MLFIKRLFTWWNGQTLNTQFFTWAKGVRVGEDDAGNVFYETRDSTRRWVIYNGMVEASRVTSDWHGWLHHTFKEPPSKKPFEHKTWEQPHQENLTGTAMAYAPAGSLQAAKPVYNVDYESWQPK